MYMCVPMCVCKCVYLCVYIHVCTCAWVYTCVPVCTHVCTFEPVCVPVYTCVCKVGNDLEMQFQNNIKRIKFLILSNKSLKIFKVGHYSSLKLFSKCLPSQSLLA